MTAKRKAAGNVLGSLNLGATLAVSSIARKPELTTHRDRRFVRCVADSGRPEAAGLGMALVARKTMGPAVFVDNVPMNITGNTHRKRLIDIRDNLPCSTHRIAPLR